MFHSGNVRKEVRQPRQGPLPGAGPRLMREQRSAGPQWPWLQPQARTARLFQTSHTGNSPGLRDKGEQLPLPVPDKLRELLGKGSEAPCLFSVSGNGCVGGQAPLSSEVPPIKASQDNLPVFPSGPQLLGCVVRTAGGPRGPFRSMWLSSNTDTVCPVTQFAGAQEGLQRARGMWVQLSSANQTEEICKNGKTNAIPAHLFWKI